MSHQEQPGKFAAPRREGIESWQDLPSEREGRISYRDDAKDNACRASAGMAALRRYAEISFGTDEEPETVMGDLLGDLQHAADALGIDFETMLEHGNGHYQAELRGAL